MNNKIVATVGSGNADIFEVLEFTPSVSVGFVLLNFYMFVIF